MSVRKWITAAAALLVLVLSGCGAAEKPCLSMEQMEQRISKIDTYSWYDPRDPDSIMRLSPEKFDAVEDIEDRACEIGRAHV